MVTRTQRYEKPIWNKNFYIITGRPSKDWGAGCSQFFEADGQPCTEMVLTASPDITAGPLHDVEKLRQSPRTGADRAGGCPDGVTDATDTPANLFWSGIALAVTMMLISFILNVIAAVREASRSRQDLP
jgi:hypothetical protein